MRGKRLPLILFVVLILAGFAQLAIYFPKLPAEVVTQYTTKGEPDTTLVKAAVGGIHALILAGCTAYFLLAGLLIHKLPPRYFKVLPHSDHWLSPERREASLGYLSRMILWLGVATVCMFLAIFELIYLSNTTGVNVSAATASSLISTLYLSYVFFFVIKLKNRFKLDEPA